MRIAYCLDEIEATGGLERVVVAKANALCDIPGNEVFLVVAYHRKDNPVGLDARVNLTDLNVRYYDDIGLGMCQ